MKINDISFERISKFATLPKVLITAIAMFSVVLLIGCNSKNDANSIEKTCIYSAVPPHVYTTISSDGKMIATLSYEDNCGNMRVNYKNIDQNGPWQNLPVPKDVKSIQFGLSGHELMLTRYLDPQNHSWSALYQVDLNNLLLEPKKIYEAYGLFDPIEIKNNEIMVLNCVVTVINKCDSRIGWQWDLIKNGKLIHRWPFMSQPNLEVGEYHRGNLNFGKPNVVPGHGAFWFKVNGYYRDGEPFPDFWRVAFPGKTAPKFTKLLDKTTEGIVCDYKVERCIRTFIRDKNPQEAYKYEYEVLWREERCNIDGVIGFSDSYSITPDGLAFIMSVFTS